LEHSKTGERKRRLKRTLNKTNTAFNMIVTAKCFRWL